MNLVLSGPIDDDLRDGVAALVDPRAIVRLHEKAYRYERADDASETRTRVATRCDASRVDHAYVEEGKRFSDFKLLAMDMDSTLITIECIDEIADFAGKKKEVAAITEAAMRGEIPDFAESLRRRVELLAGTPVDVLERVFNERLTLSPGAFELLDAAARSGIHTILVSGGFDYFTDRLKQMLPITEAHGNKLGVQHDRLTGKVMPPILDSRAKASYVGDALTALRCDPSDAIAIGDGANDIPMLRMVCNSIAYHAKPLVNRESKHSIKHGRLDALLDFFA